MIFANRVPPKARAAYTKDTWSGLTGNIAMGMTLPFVAVIARKQLHASDIEIAVITMAPIACNLLSLLWANIMEGRRKMPFMVVPMFVSRCILFLFVFANTSSKFVTLIASMFFVLSIAGPAYSALMKEIYPDSDRGRIMGYVRIIAVGVYVPVTLISGWLLAHVSYRYIFPVAGLIGLVSPFIFNKIPTSDTTGDSDTKLGAFLHESVMILKNDKGFLWFSAGIFVFGTANLMATPIYVTYQVDVLGVNTLWSSYYATVISILQVLAYGYWGSYMDRKSPMKAVAIGQLMWIVVPLTYCFATQPWMLLPTAILQGIMQAAFELSYLSGVLHYAPHDKVAQYQAIFASLAAIRGIFAPYIGAVLVQSHIMSPRGVFLIAAVIMIISYVVQVYGIRKYDGRKHVTA